MTTPMAVNPTARTVPARRRALSWAVLAIVTVALRALRLQRIERLARLLNRRARRSATVREVTGLLDAIDQTSPWLPARVACLERSLAVVLWCGLRDTPHQEDRCPSPTTSSLRQRLRSTTTATSASLTDRS